MERQRVIDSVHELKSKYSMKASEMLAKTVNSIDAQSACNNSIVASRYEAKVDVLEELLEMLAEER